MNERIKELRVEAVNYTNELKPLGLTMWDLTCNQKFAELLVKECALQCNHNDDMDRILEHFGVEE
jgi:hypothetical protein